MGQDREIDVSRRDLGALLGLLGGAAGVAALASCTVEVEPSEQAPEAVGRTAEALATGSNVQWADSIAELRTLIGSANGSGGPAVILLQGYSIAGDGGGGAFCWDISSHTGDDGGTIIVPKSPDGGSQAAGRWKRIYYGPLNVKWFGAQGTGSTSDTSAIESAIAAALSLGNGTVHFPPGLYSVTAQINIAGAVTLRGDGIVPGGIGSAANGYATILHNFSGYLFVFDGTNGPGAGGGVEHLRIVQSYTQSGQGLSQGSAIVIRSTGISQTPSWITIRDCKIEETTQGYPWTWAINIDGSLGDGGDAGAGTLIPNLRIAEVSSHTLNDGGGSSGAIRVFCASSVKIYNCELHDTGDIVIDGTPQTPSSSVSIVGGDGRNIYCGNATYVSVTGGQYSSITPNFPLTYASSKTTFSNFQPGLVSSSCNVVTATASPMDVSNGIGIVLMDPGLSTLTGMTGGSPQQVVTIVMPVAGQAVRGGAFAKSGSGFILANGSDCVASTTYATLQVIYCPNAGGSYWAEISRSTANH